MPDGELNQVGYFVHIQFDVEVSAVDPHPFDADVNWPGNLLVAKPLPNQVNNVYFPEV
jgi:hypothetical protein